MTTVKRSTEGSVYQIKVVLKGSRPPIWRRIQVDSDTTLGELHHILQVAMGWYDAHLHQFIVGHTHYGVPHPDYFMEMLDEDQFTLNQIVTGEKFRFHYEYDFGDSWEHTLQIEKILPPEEGVEYPICLKGRRACPPEDVGGVWGYQAFLEIIQHPDHPEHEHYMEWIGGDFDPEAFDADQVNAALRDLQQEPESIAFDTSIGTFVYHTDDPPHSQYYLFRPDHHQTLEDITRRQRAGEELDYEEVWRRIARFGVLMLAVYPDGGFTADLYLDRDIVEEDEVETIVQGTCEFLEQIPLGTDGGSLSVFWMEEIAEYSFNPDET